MIYKRKCIEDGGEHPPQKITFRIIRADPVLYKPILVGIVVNLSMQLSGIDAVFFYSTMIFTNAGIPQEWAQLATVAVGCVNVLVTIPAMFLMDRAGRKTIQSIGLGGMAFAHCLITYALVNNIHMLSVVAMFFIIIFFAFGPGCIGWFLVSEITPIHVRGLALSLGLGANWFANWFVGFIFPHLMNLLGNWCFLIFCITCASLTTFTLLCVPETSGKTVAEVSKFFVSDVQLGKSLPRRGSLQNLLMTETSDVSKRARRLLVPRGQSCVMLNKLAGHEDDSEDDWEGEFCRSNSRKSSAISGRSDKSFTVTHGLVCPQSR